MAFWVVLETKCWIFRYAISSSSQSSMDCFPFLSLLLIYSRFSDFDCGGSAVERSGDLNMFSTFWVFRGFCLFWMFADVRVSFPLWPPSALTSSVSFISSYQFSLISCFLRVLFRVSLWELLINTSAVLDLLLLALVHEICVHFLTLCFCVFLWSNYDFPVAAWL